MILGIQRLVGYPRNKPRYFHNRTTHAKASSTTYRTGCRFPISETRRNICHWDDKSFFGTLFPSGHINTIVQCMNKLSLTLLLRQPQKLLNYKNGYKLDFNIFCLFISSPNIEYCAKQSSNIGYFQSQTADVKSEKHTL